MKYAHSALGGNTTNFPQIQAQPHKLPSNSTLDEASKTALAIKALQGSDKDADKCLEAEFRMWLEGIHPVHNASESDKTAHNLDENKMRGMRKQRITRDKHGAQLLPDNQWKDTHWGNASLVTLPGVREYLTGDQTAHTQAMANMNVLAELGPKNINEAWTYFKYWVKGAPVQAPCQQESTDGGDPIDLMTGWQAPRPDRTRPSGGNDAPNTAKDGQYFGAYGAPPPGTDPMDSNEDHTGPYDGGGDRREDYSRGRNEAAHSQAAADAGGPGVFGLSAEQMAQLATLAKGNLTAAIQGVQPGAAMPTVPATQPPNPFLASEFLSEAVARTREIFADASLQAMEIDEKLYTTTSNQWAKQQTEAQKLLETNKESLDESTAETLRQLISDGIRTARQNQNETAQIQKLREELRSQDLTNAQRLQQQNDLTESYHQLAEQHRSTMVSFGQQIAQITRAIEQNQAVTPAPAPLAPVAQAAAAEPAAAEPAYEAAAAEAAAEAAYEAAATRARVPLAPPPPAPAPPPAAARAAASSRAPPEPELVVKSELKKEPLIAPPGLGLFVSGSAAAAVAPAAAPGSSAMHAAMGEPGSSGERGFPNHEWYKNMDKLDPNKIVDITGNLEGDMEDDDDDDVAEEVHAAASGVHFSAVAEALGKQKETRAGKALKQPLPKPEASFESAVKGIAKTRATKKIIALVNWDKYALLEHYEQIAESNNVSLTDSLKTADPQVRKKVLEARKIRNRERRIENDARIARESLEAGWLSSNLPLPDIFTDQRRLNMRPRDGGGSFEPIKAARPRETLNTAPEARRYFKALSN